MTTILCVDDNADLVELLSNLLNMVGYDTRTASGGEECLRLLNDEEFHPDLILLDIMMEPMDGWETLRHIRALPGRRNIPVVMLTGKHPTMSEAETYGPLIDDYLMKPYHPHQIKEDITQVLARVDHVHEVIARARAHDVEEEVIADYARLASTVEVLKKFKTILGTIEPFNDELLHKTEGRFTGIKGQLVRAGVAL
ncbi:MAG: response regulator [Methanoregula sp.]|nr:response regulator [Methanoregula sp.]